eukprot:g28418.t1
MLQAGIRFWLEQISKRRRSRDLIPSDPSSWLWPTADEPVMRATKLEVQQARSWTLEDLERVMTRFFDLRRRICPKTPILVPLNELRLHSVQTQCSSTPEQIRLHLKEVPRASPTRRSQTMQSLSIFHASEDGLRPASDDQGPASAALLRMKALHEMELRSILKSMEENAVRRKTQGNMAMEKGEFRQAVKEYSCALQHAGDMMDFLELEKSPALNGYQLRALAKGMPLPQRGPKALQPFRAVAFASRALAFLRLDAYEQCLEDATAACDLEPKYLKAWIRRACALAALNRRADAEDALNEALEKACHSDLLREQVCKLLVNLHNLVNVVVKPPEKALTVSILASFFRAVFAFRGLTWFKGPVLEPPDGRCFLARSWRPLTVDQPEDWKPTLSGAAIWAQSHQELFLVLRLPRRPKVSELRIEISPRHLLGFLRKPGMTSVTEDDFDLLINAELLVAVKPSECSWQLEQVADATDLHVTLHKEVAQMVLEGFK